MIYYNIQRLLFNLVQYIQINRALLGHIEQSAPMEAIALAMEAFNSNRLY